MYACTKILKIAMYNIRTIACAEDIIHMQQEEQVYVRRDENKKSGNTQIGE